MLLRVGSRGSRLALTQAERAAELLRRPGVEIALVPITFLQAFLTRSMGSPLSTVAPTSADIDATLVTSVVLGIIQVLVIQPFLTAAVAKALFAYELVAQPWAQFDVAADPQPPFGGEALAHEWPGLGERQAMADAAQQVQEGFW